MAPRKPAATKAAAKPAESKLKDVEEAVAGEAEKLVHAAEAEVEKVLHSPAAEKVEEISAEGLRKLHDEAIIAEDAVKRELAVARQRAANMATHVDDAVDQEIIALKAKAQELHAYIKQLEEKLAGELKDIWGTTF